VDPPTASASTHQPINPAQNFRKSSSCHQARSDWPRTVQLVLPRIRPTSVEHGLNFLQAIDILVALTAQCGLRHACALSNPHTLLTAHMSSTIGPFSSRCDGASPRHICPPPLQASETSSLRHGTSNSRPTRPGWHCRSMAMASRYYCHGVGLEDQ
jgi:hypothetical protein